MTNNLIQITGATGFLGGNLMEYLHLRGYKVSNINLRTSKATIEEETRAIIHMAGKAHDTRRNSDEATYFDTNTLLTKKMFDAFIHSNAKAFIYISSVKAVTDSVIGQALEENAIPNPQTAYGLSKLKAEQYLLSQQLGNDKKLYIIRPCMIHGKGNKGNLNALYKFVAKGIPYPLAAYNNQRSFLSVGNYCFLMERLLSDFSVPQGIYHMADDETLSTNELVQIIAKSIGKKARLWKLPKVILNNIAKVGDFFGLSFNSEKLTKLTENYIVSNTKIKQALGVNKLPMNAQDGITETIGHFAETG